MKNNHEMQEESLRHKTRRDLHQIFISKILKSQRFLQNLVLYTFLIGLGFGLGFILNSHLQNFPISPQLLRLYSPSSSSPSPSPSPQPQPKNTVYVKKAVAPDDVGGHTPSSFSPSPSPKPQPENNISVKEAVAASDGGQKCHSLIVAENLMHNMTEEELFSCALKTQETPTNMTKKVAFMFLTRGKLPLAKVWERFFKGHQDLYSIYIHTSDLNYVDDDTSKTSPFYGRRIPSKEVVWSEISMDEAERRLLANAMVNPANHRFVLLSEADIPLFNFSTIYSYLINSQQTYVEVYDLPGWAGRDRCNPDMSPLVTLNNWRKGSQWVEMDREVALAVVSDTIYFPLFQKYCHWGCYGEHYFATFAHIMFSGKNTNRTLMWADWSLGGSHPMTYAGENVTAELFRNLRNREEGCVYNGKKTNTCYLFARKFDNSSLDTLIYFANKIMAF